MPLGERFRLVPQAAAGTAASTEKHSSISTASSPPTSTASPAQLHHRHSITSTASPAQLHHQHSSTTSIASPAQHHNQHSITSTASSPAHLHQHISISPAPPPAQLRPAPRPSAPPGPEPPLPGAQRGGSAGRQRQQPRPCIIHPAEEMSPPAGGISPALPHQPPPPRSAPGVRPAASPPGDTDSHGGPGTERGGITRGMPNFSH